MSSAIQSPCIQVCELNSDNLCTGCMRSADEIGRWTLYSDEEREKIMQSLKARQEHYLATAFD